MKLLIDIPDKIYNRVAGAPRCADILDAFEDRDMFVKALQTGTIVNTVQTEINLSGTTNGDIIKTLFPGGTENIGRKRIYYSVYPTGVMEFDIIWWNAPYEATEKQSDANLRFEWKDAPDIGHYECYLYEGDKKIDEMNFTDYTCEFRQNYDRKNRYTRAYSFYASWCDGWSMGQGFDYDANYNNHSDVDGHLIGGYQGTSTHTVDDIKKWCENWLAQGYLKAYYNTMKELDQMTARAKWFEDHGFCLEEKEA